MDPVSLEGAIAELLTNTPLYGKHNQASFDYLAAQGDAAVPVLVSAIRGAVGRLDEKSPAPALFGIRAAIGVLASLDTARSRAALLELLNADWPPSRRVSAYGYVIDALNECATADLVPGLIGAASGPCVAHRPQNLARLYLLVRKLGGSFPLRADQAIKVVIDSPSTPESLTIIDDFARDLPNWDGGTRADFFWFYAHKMEQVHRDEPLKDRKHAPYGYLAVPDAALPFYAASVLANPGSASSAWSKFQGVKPSLSEAQRLARKYPLPEPFGPSAHKSGWRPW